MSDDRKLSVYMEGHDGHRGNVLAHAWVSKVGQLLSVFARMERRFNDSDRRQTAFEITDTKKQNPTILTLKPVPSAKSYDPGPAIDWTLSEIGNVANERPVDSRVDAETADMLAALARPSSADGYKRFWLNGHAAPVEFDAQFRAKAEAVAARRRAECFTPDWFEGVAIGSVIGRLNAVDDEFGNRNFVINPTSGPKRIECRFPESERQTVGAHLFEQVQVTGLLTYSKASPHPVSVEMHSLEVLKVSGAHLLDMEGLFAGYGRNEPENLAFLNG